MDMKRFSAFKYQHKGSYEVSPARIRVAKATAVLALIAAIAFFPAGLAAFLVPLIVYYSAPKMLYLGPRYLICGDVIVYFGNVVRMELNEADGILKLVTAGKQTFVLDRANFPTNARKSHKIEANKAEKFDKASSRLIDRILRATPEVEQHGIPANATQTEIPL